MKTIQMLYIVIDTAIDLTEKIPFVDIIGVFDNADEAIRAQNLMLEIYKNSDVKIKKQKHHYHMFHIPIKSVVKVPHIYDEKIGKEAFIKYGYLEKGD